MDGIGDALSCTPLVAALRAAGHEVSALLTTVNADIFAHRTFCNVHVMQRIPWPKHGYSAGSQEPAFRAILEAKYDIALIASEEPQAYGFARSARIPMRVGFHNGWQKPLKSWWACRQCTRAVYRPAALSEFPQHEVHVQFSLVEGLCAENVPTHDVRRLRPLVLDGDPQRQKRPLLQLTNKWFGPNRSARDVASWLHSLQALGEWRVVAAASERCLVEPIARQAALRVEYFQALGPWKEAIASAGVVLTPDTGAAHLAGMLGTPVVDVFERHNFERYVRRWAPWATSTRLLKFPAAAEKKTFAETMGRCVAELGTQTVARA